MKTRLRFKLYHLPLIIIGLFAIFGFGGCTDIVKHGEIKALRNLDYNPLTDTTESAYTGYVYEGGDYSKIKNDDKLADLTAAVVGENQLGVHILSYDANKIPVVEYLPQGTYPKISQEFVKNIGAAEVPGDQMGFLCNYTEGQDNFLILPPGTPSISELLGTKLANGYPLIPEIRRQCVCRI